MSEHEVFHRDDALIVSLFRDIAIVDIAGTLDDAGIRKVEKPSCEHDATMKATSELWLSSEPQRPSPVSSRGMM